MDPSRLHRDIHPNQCIGVTMSVIDLKASERTPAIHFDFTTNRYKMSGESFPEDVNVFYGPLMKQLEQHLEAQSNQDIEFTFSLIYFNSSTAKVLMGLFDMLDSAAEDGNRVLVLWEYEEEDDGIIEMGEDFGSELEYAGFEFKRIEEA
jgi:hypothetical protein